MNGIFLNEIKVYEIRTSKVRHRSDSKRACGELFEEFVFVFEPVSVVG